MYRDDKITPSPQRLSRRMTVLVALSLLLFSVVFFRLWYLQVLSGDKYLDEARNNQVRDIRTQAPRGEILDRNGKVLVGNQTTQALQVTPALLPHGAQRARELKALGPVAEMTPTQIEAAIKASVAKIPEGPVTLRRGLVQDKVFFLQENQSRFPGVDVQRVFVRRYDQGDIAAQLFGNVGEVTAEQLKQPGYQRLLPGDTVGQSGLEFTYDRFLRGDAGTTKIQVDARGRPKGQISTQQAVPGNSLRLSIDSNVQRAGEAALSSYQLPGGFVAMDPDTGAVIALGSYPSFNPAIFTKPLTAKQYRRLTSKKTGAPLFNRAIGGAYPTGSTFKPITAIAALTSKLITPQTRIFDSGSIKVGELEFKNSGEQHLGFGSIDLPAALKFSSDVFFYILGSRLEDKGEAIQHWAEQLGLGSRTGIDLPSEGSGLIPTPQWRNRLFKEGLTDRPWSVGDNINLAVGQGDLQADPLQMAVAYSALVNGGEVVRPHIGDQVQDAAGRVLQEVRPAPRRKVKVKPAFSKAILDGMHLAAQSPGGTSFPVFGNFPIQLAGKTGTAERPGQQDQAWYVAVAPYNHPRIVIALTIEKGGFGVDTAAPAVQRMLAAYFHVKPGAPSGNPGAPTTPGGNAPAGAARAE